MTPAEFWRSTPRIVNLFVEGYLRRRAWAAFHAGYGLHAKDAELAHLLGKPATKPAMTPEQMLANLDRHAARLRARDRRCNQE